MFWHFDIWFMSCLLLFNIVEMEVGGGDDEYDEDGDDSIGSFDLLARHHGDKFFIINLAISVYIGFSDHFVNFFIC